MNKKAIIFISVITFLLLISPMILFVLTDIRNKRQERKRGEQKIPTNIINE
jgi:hypothetical protein